MTKNTGRKAKCRLYAITKTSLTSDVLREFKYSFQDFSNISVLWIKVWRDGGYRVLENYYYKHTAYSMLGLIYLFYCIAFLPQARKLKRIVSQDSQSLVFHLTFPICPLNITKLFSFTAWNSFRYARFS